MSEEARNSDMPTEDVQAEIEAHREQFGLPAREEQEPEQQEPQEDETNEEPEQGEDQEPSPAREKLKVKFNKEEIEVDEEQIPELVQKGLALDKERQRKTEYEKALERAAKLAGFNSHEEYMANLEQLEQQAKQREQDQFQQLRKQLREEAEYAGLDPDKVEQFIDNHPLLKQAQAAIKEREQYEQQLQEQERLKQAEQKWEELFKQYPELAAEVDEDGNAPWMTDEMISRIDRGYDPIDAYELAHRDVITQQTRKKAEQETLKKQRLNKRSLVEDQKGGSPQESEVPTELVSAFSLFGLPTKNAKKYVKAR